MEWIVAAGACLVVSALVIGLPLYLAMTRWSSRGDRRAAEARRRAATYPGPPVPTSRARRRKVPS
jgi:hypothetical protein